MENIKFCQDFVVACKPDLNRGSIMYGFFNVCVRVCAYKHEQIKSAKLGVFRTHCNKAELIPNIFQILIIKLKMTQE